MSSTTTVNMQAANQYHSLDNTRRNGTFLIFFSIFFSKSSLYLSLDSTRRIFFKRFSKGSLFFFNAILNLKTVHFQKKRKENREQKNVSTVVLLLSCTFVLYVVLLYSEASIVVVVVVVVVVVE